MIKLFISSVNRSSGRMMILWLCFGGKQVMKQVMKKFLLKG